MYESDIITVAVLNFKVIAGKKEENLSRIIDFSKSAAKRGADLILFPEMCIMGYDYYVDEEVTRKEKEDSAETFDGLTCTRIAEAAVNNEIYIIAGMAEKDIETGSLYNSAYVAGPGGAIGAYRKIHPYDYENTWCEKGDKPFVFETKWGPVSVGICYDTYQFPELMRYYAHKGSRLYLNPTALPEAVTYEGSRAGFINYYCRAIEYGASCNTIFIANSNLAGWDKFNYFGGGSCIVGPGVNPSSDVGVKYYAGDTGSTQAELFLATVDLSLATRDIFKDNFNGTPDYRPDVYKELFDNANPYLSPKL